MIRKIPLICGEAYTPISGVQIPFFGLKTFPNPINGVDLGQLYLALIQVQFLYSKRNPSMNSMYVCMSLFL